MMSRVAPLAKTNKFASLVAANKKQYHFFPPFIVFLGFSQFSATPNWCSASTW